MVRAHLSVILMLFSVTAFASDDDVVEFAPGSKMVGELKRLERGRLYFKTEASDTIPLEWDKVTRLISSQTLRVELSNGRRYLGQLVEQADPSHVAVKVADSTQKFPMVDVVRIDPIEEARRDRWDVELSAGYNFTKASDVQQFNLGVSSAYVQADRRLEFSADVNTTNDSNGDETKRLSADVRNRRLRENRWFTGFEGTLERHDALGIDLRTSVGIGGGRFLRQSNRFNLAVSGGLRASREQVLGAGDDETSLEGAGRIEVELFRYDEPELDLTTNLQVIPNLTDFGRVRAEFDITLRWELVEDLFWRLEVYDSYDSDPISLEAEKNDYGIVTGLLLEI